MFTLLRKVLRLVQKYQPKYHGLIELIQHTPPSTKTLTSLTAEVLSRIFEHVSHPPRYSYFCNPGTCPHPSYNPPAP